MQNRQKEKRTLKSFTAILLSVIMLISVSPFHLIVIAEPTVNQKFIEAVNGLADVLTPADDSGGTDKDKVWNDYLRNKFYSSIGGVDINGNVAVNDWAPAWSSNTIEWKWSGNTATTTAATGTERPSVATAIPYKQGTAYYVWSGEQLLYALTDCAVSGGTIQIMDDIDLNGQADKNWDAIDFPNETISTVIEGNNHTIHNLQSIDCKSIMGYTTYYAGLIGSIGFNNDFSIKNLDFTNANLVAVVKDANGFKCPNNDGNKAHAVGIIARSGAKNILIENVHITNSLFAGGSYVGALFGRSDNGGADAVAGQNHIIKNCSVQNLVAYGDFHVGSLGGSLTFSDDTSFCFSAGCTVVSVGGHSGGLFGCVSGIIKLHDCFVDAEVYGTNQTGVFSGIAVVSKLSNGQIGGAVVNCFASGFVEGKTQLGGFVGIAGGVSAFINCYTTALVGLRSQGTKLGGFMGDTLSGYNYTAFINCYAAGEVGSADIDSTNTLNKASTFDGSGNVVTQGNPIIDNNNGGFVGYSLSNNRLLYAYSYYDKQTTAMREWKAGIVNGQSIFSLTGSSYAGQFASIIKNSANVSLLTANKPGLTGTLTTSTEKNGIGLVNSPGGTKGFVGFMGLSDFPENAQSLFFTTSAGLMDISWNYAAANHYPELNCMINADEDDWGKYAALVKDYSKTSTATIELETWEKSLDKESGQLVVNSAATTAYDTVRDLTEAFYCTGINTEYKWNRIATATGSIGSDPNINGATVTIAEKPDISVAVLKTKNTSLNGETGTFSYLSEFAPGLEWLSVKYGQAERRLRFMPTVGIEAGKSMTIYRPSEYAPNSVKDAAFYDHANDVEMYYSTANRLDKNINDITTGIYPDASGDNIPIGNHMTKGADFLTERQILLMSNSSDSAISTYFTDNNTDNSYGLQTTLSTTTHVGVDVSFMSREQNNEINNLVLKTNSANGSALFVYAREVTGIAANGALTTGSGLFDFADVLNSDTYNGLALGAHGDQMLMFQYVWMLSDGRIISDAKLITVKATPFYAKITAYDAGGTNENVDILNKTDKDTPENDLDDTIGLLDTNDLLIDVKKVVDDENIGGVKTDEEVAANMQGFTPAKRTTDYLYPYTVDPVSNLPVTPIEDIGPEYTDSLVASWKVTNPDKVVTKIIVRVDSGTKDQDGKKVFFTSEVNPAISDTVIIPYKYYRYVTSDEGQFFVQEESLDREYTIHQTSSGVYYISFNKFIVDDPDLKTDQGIPVDVIDTANNVEIELELSAIIKAEKRATGDFGDADQLFDFTLTVDDKITSEIDYRYYISHRDGTKTDKDENDVPLTISDGDSVIQMKHGDKLTVIGLPYAATYSLEESDYNDIGYLTTTNNTVGANSSGSLTVDKLGTLDGIFTADREVLFVNDKSLIPPVGIAPIEVSAFVIMVLLAMFGIVLLLLNKKRKLNLFN